MATLATRLMTWLRGELVGSDSYGNRYYRGRRRAGHYTERRWVIYHGADEASSVPSEWHGWLHHISNDVPSDDVQRHAWQRDHEPNRTGTAAAYHPPGSVLSAGQRARATGDYEAWTPP